MKRKRFHLERLLGRKVCDIDGKAAGRIEEIRAVHREGVCEIRDYLLGGGALMERLSIAGVSSSVLSILGGRNNHSTHRVPWEKMDLSDVEHPRLRCRREELEKL